MYDPEAAHEVVSPLARPNGGHAELLDRVHAGHLVLDRERRVAFANRAFHEFFIPAETNLAPDGRSLEGRALDEVLDLAAPVMPRGTDTAQAVKAILDRADPVALGEVVLSDGRTILFQFAPLPGALSHWHFIDISGLRGREERLEEELALQRALLREQRHRVANHLGSLAATLLLTKDSRSPEAARVVDETIGRVTALSRLYEHMSQSDNYAMLGLRNYLEPLVRECLHVIKGPLDIGLEVDIEDCPLHGDVLTTLGIIMNELITNAVKYAFRGCDKGMIHVRLRREGSRILLVVRDDGCGLGQSGSACFGSTGGDGVDLIGELARMALGGSCSWSEEGGTVFTLDFPVETCRGQARRA